jgi:hypothetical protein
MPWVHCVCVNAEVIDYMISDSLQIVSDSLESCLRPVISADGEEQALEKDDAFEKYLRLWRMIELIVRSPKTHFTRRTHNATRRIVSANAPNPYNLTCGSVRPKTRS